MNIGAEQARALARDWIDAFNAADLERILGHYANGVELISPVYLRFTGGRQDRLEGIDELRRYFGPALARFPELRFTFLDVSVGVSSITIRYHTNLDDQIASECLELDDQLRAVRVLCHYAPPGAPAEAWPSVQDSASGSDGEGS